MSINPQDVIPTAPNNNQGLGKSGPPQQPEKGAHDEAKKVKDKENPKPMKPNNPTVASTDGKKSILDAIKQADPGNISGFIKKAVDAMMMIRSIDGASGGQGGGGGSGGSGGGGGGAPSPTASAAMGKGLIDASKLIAVDEMLGLKAILDALNAIMPNLIPMLSDDEIDVLDDTILAIITGTNVGVLSPLEIENANATAAAIAGVSSLSETSTNEQLVAGLTYATDVIGGATLGLDPNSLAYLIITSAVGTIISQHVTMNGHVVYIQVRVDSTYIRDQLESIPTFTGTEQQDIAVDESAIISSQIAQYINTNSLTADNFVDTLRNSASRIQDKNMQKTLGTNMAGLLGQAEQLIKQFAGNINDSKDDHQKRGKLETITDALQDHTKILSLIKKKLDVSDIFDKMKSMAGQAPQQMQQMMGQIQGAISGSGIASAMNASSLIPMTSTVQAGLHSMLQSGQNPLMSLDAASLNDLVSSSQTMLNNLSQSQVSSMLSALPPSLVMSMMGERLSMMSNLDTNEINTLLAKLPQSTVTMLLQSTPTIINFHNATSSPAEITSDIAAALSSVISTQPVGTILKTILPNGTTVICEVTHSYVD